MCPQSCGQLHFGFLGIELFLHRAQDLVKCTHGLLHHMEAIDDVHLGTKDRLDGTKERFGQSALRAGSKRGSSGAFSTAPYHG